MLVETQLKQSFFIREILENPPAQVIEEAASESHETRRLPDPWVYANQDGKLTTPEGKVVEKIINKNDYLGRTESQAFQKIQGWFNQKNEGVVLWFSPPFPDNQDRPNLKIIISEIITSGNIKVLFNRAIVLDIDTHAVLNLANDLTENKVEHSELLRSTPLFPSSEEFLAWFKKLPEITSQAELIENGEDLEIKRETYKSLEKIRIQTSTEGGVSSYTTIYEEADRRGLIGEYAGSCGGGRTAFATLLENTIPLGGEKILRCTCPFCHTQVSATISGGRIYCPNCSKSAEYTC